jgi:RNA polymerase sigma factor for flagellar operon FliA
VLDVVGGGGRQLVEEHLWLVHRVACEVRAQLTSHPELDELCAYGAEGLLEAAGRFDPAHDVKFASYAWHRVRGAIFDGLREMGQLGRGDYGRLQAARRASERLDALAAHEHCAAYDAPPPPAPIAAELRAIHDALAAVTLVFPASLDALAAEGVEPAAELDPLDEALHARRLVPRLRDALARLPERERRFVEQHYFEGRSLGEVAAELGLSRSWASRLHARAMARLRGLLSGREPATGA